MLKVKKFQECTYMRLYSVKQNIEGDANLYHPPKNRVKDHKCFFTVPISKIIRCTYGGDVSR